MRRSTVDILISASESAVYNVDHSMSGGTLTLLYLQLVYPPVKQSSCAKLYRICVLINCLYNSSFFYDKMVLYALNRHNVGLALINKI